MTAPSANPIPPAGPGLGRRERMLLAAVAAALALLLIWLRGGLHPEASLEALARRSPALESALADGRPTLVEFYADWCEACRAMAPAMDTLERQHRGSLDVVLLNVDNPRWQPEVERYEVNGIPHLELFDAEGRAVGRSRGARRPDELAALGDALLAGSPLPSLAGVGAISSLDVGSTIAAATTSTGAPVGPRSHG
ncbi:MAG: thioredoxin domain-containing protein [Synechococcaceae cyanobacterium]|jgi:thiol-disulfide isomerase/thioredoxin